MSEHQDYKTWHDGVLFALLSFFISYLIFGVANWKPAKDSEIEVRYYEQTGTEE